MSDRGLRTEQPTPQRIRKARAEGRFPSSREFVAAVQFAVFTAIITGLASKWWPALLASMKQMLAAAFVRDLNPTVVSAAFRGFIAPGAFLLLGAGALIAGMQLLAQMGSTGFGLAVTKLTPDFSRLNPAAALRELPARNRRAFFEALVLLPLLSFIAWGVVRQNLDSYLRLPLLPVSAAARIVGQSMADLLWKAAGAFLVWGSIDLFRQSRRYKRDLMMTKQEVREEHKQNEGNPEIKMRIRRLRRELLRRRMMAEVPKATAVIVNPTHFAVALRYNMQNMAAPKVVAKGKNYLALRIREKALVHQVPVIENAPLAQALYKQAEVGQEIPAHLYRAVAEVLAYIFRLMKGRLPGTE